MDSKCDAVLPSEFCAVERGYSDEQTASAVYGFPISENQFNILTSEQATASQQTTQSEEGLIDPRTTQRLRWARQRAEALKARSTEALYTTVSLETAQGICTNSENVINPVAAIPNSSPFVNSFSADPSVNFAVQAVGSSVHYQLETDVSDGGGDSLLYSDLICNKRISYAGPEWSAGRPGHTPTRRDNCMR